ncbi:MAG: hypothetical protein ACJA2X_000200 [Halocynthiibacter sp.]|jgi:hypothetical protein
MFPARKNLKSLGIVGAFVFVLMIGPLMKGAQNYGFEGFGYILILLGIVLGVALLSIVVLRKLGSGAWTVCAMVLGFVIFGGVLMMMGTSGWDGIAYFLLLAGVLVPLLVGWLLGGAYQFFRWRKQGFRGDDPAKQNADEGDA